MNQPEVTIEQGTLRGSVGTDLRGKKFYKFKGIPYAKPPLGKLRFKAPLPPEKWTGIFDATKEGDKCYHRDPFNNMKADGSENCLVLNVFTKKLPDGHNKVQEPVMFWIHGGGFVWGHGGEEFYGPEFLMTEDLVLVTFNYRLGMLGFINFEDPSLEIPGNTGLKDQVMALKWVQKNIAKFGGDPNNVTIFGDSAGGASVHLHVLSPMSTGLFHRAIAHSGCALNPWVKGTTGVGTIARSMGLEGANEKTIYDSLMSKSKEEILEIQHKIPDEFMPSILRQFGAVIEKNSKEAFMPDEPINIIKSGKFNQVDFMLGYTSKELIIYELLGSHTPDQLFFENLIPVSFGYKVGSPESRAVGEKIKKYYFGNEDPFDERNVSTKYDALADPSLLYDIYITIENHLAASKNPIYFYRVSVETELNYIKKFLKVNIPGVSHMDDLGYLFKTSFTPEIKPGSAEDIALTKFVKLWTNFAKFGNPTPDRNDSLLKVNWIPVTGSNVDFLDIGIDLVPGTNPEKVRIEFWKKLFAKSPAGQKNA